MRELDLPNEILDEIARRAPHYTPEWRYNKENPDAGTALAMIWADMHAGTLERFSWLHDNFKRALLDAIGTAPRPAAPACGFLAFEAREDAGDFIIPKGTQVAAPSSPDAALVTCQNLAASNARISDIYCVIPHLDSVCRLNKLKDTELIRDNAGVPHVWTFAHDFALNVSSAASLRLTPEVEDADLEALADAIWEYGDGQDWRGLSIIRDGASLLCVFPNDKSRCDALRLKATHDAVLHGLIAKPSGKDILPDALYIEGSQTQDGFFPFGERFIPGVCAYFTNADALTKPGARVELAFTLSFEAFEREGYAQEQIQMRNIMRASEFDPPEEYTICAAQTKWEYYNGVGWASLDIDAEEELFCGKTTGRMKLAFDCPKDISPAVVGAHDLPFIRIRLLAADNLYRRYARYESPYLSDIRFSYRYEQGVPVTDIGVNEHLDIFKKTLPARLAQMPEGPTALYFASDNAFTRGTMLFHIRQGGKNASTRWEYLSKAGFVPLNVRDDTEGLSKTGIVSYQTSEAAANARLWGREGYWMRLVLEDAELSGIYLHGIYENAVRAVSKEPGEGGALPAGAFTTIVTPLLEVVSALNPLASFGGAGAEDEIGVIERMSAALSHSGRAVSRFDCEELAKEASPRIQRVRYYQHTDERGKYAYDQSCLVVLARDTEEFGFDDLRDELFSYIMPRRALGSERLFILPPRYIAVNVFANVMIESHSEALSVKEGIDDALKALLSPANWPIGHLPAPGQISAAIRAVSGVLRLIRSDVSYTLTSGVSASFTKAEREAFILPASGRHEYTFVERGIV